MTCCVLLPGYLPGLLDVTDRDQRGTPNSKITVSLISQEPKEPKIGLKQMYNSQVQVVLKSGCFDYDVRLCRRLLHTQVCFFLMYVMSASKYVFQKIKKYEVHIKATDQGKPAMSSTAVLTINVLDANTHPPMFKQKEVELLI